MKYITTILLTLSIAVGQGLSKEEKAIQSYVEMHTNEAINLLEKVVNINSGTLNIKGNKKVGKIFQKELDKLGFKTYWVTYPNDVKRSGHLFAEMRGGTGKKIVMVGHLDTVFEPDHPFQTYTRTDDTAYGPGVSDMKGGDISMIYAMKALKKVGVLKDLNLTLVFIGDEEKLGAPPAIVRKELIDAGKWADIGLGFEGAHGMNTGTISRRSSSSWILTTTGIQGHSSQIFKDKLGYGAIFESSRILNAFREELAPEEYLTFNPGTIVGGTDVVYDPVNSRGSTFGKTNVVAQSVTVHGGIRTISMGQLEKAMKSMKEIASRNLPGTTANIEFKTSYPPMEPTKANYALLDKFEAVNIALGYGKLEALDPSKRGAADISFIAPHVNASLAGLGPDGFGGHSENEGLDLSTFPRTTTRAAILIYRLTQ
ncbi:MAG: M20/M25/M40 family metallo-hydrolase [Candidatus Marinimicrobia bacterium]|jgi:glutamate carboxypeptidase|nr:M20/M25/M40 family metallo-hydrolase [Candidatus Neomarinimicrobiota bacterium]MBT4067909.1 M20/M25/M40 family metallo-hydrolase [Candidatus Neomarinimicrobiota bacterium]MBT5175938.1 M20/M25/M40 family metallo-hydrolase [Candidatus Neomarinimicrobiota bacterium]MBT6129509.1 M20/M25/M40 family metallo-hydrolase [Candidatus Neomarinimicrobiota bacterium]MBT6417852.1 M20/M25/M40 family metallo-hydrolase [Candidatus Neomarinimicrobiota bacterium]